MSSCRREVATRLVVVIVTVSLLSTAAVGSVGAGGAEAVNGTAAGSTDAAVGTVQQTTDNSCVVEVSGAAISDNFAVSCSDFDGDNATVTVAGSGGWAYAAFVNVSSSTQVADFGLTSAYVGAAPGTLTQIGARTVPRLPDDIKQAWASELGVPPSKAGIVTQATLRTDNRVVGSDADSTIETKLYRHTDSEINLDLSEGVYQFDLVAYKQTPYLRLGDYPEVETSGDQVRLAIQEGWQVSGTVTVEIGDGSNEEQCRADFDTEQSRMDAYDQQRDGRADTRQSIRQSRTQRASHGGVTDTQATQTASTGNSNSAMMSSLPDLTGNADLQGQLDTSRGADIYERLNDMERLNQHFKDPSSAESLQEWDTSWADTSGEELTADISEEHARGAVADALESRGIQPPAGTGLSLEDYVMTDVGKSTRYGSDGHRQAMVRVGPNGNILPPESEIPSSNTCGGQTLQYSSSWLTVDFYQLPNQASGKYAVQSKMIEVQTSRITQAKMDGIYQSRYDLDSVTTDVVNGIDGIEGASDGHVSQSGDSGGASGGGN